MTDILQEPARPAPGPGDPIPPHLRGWLHLICFVASLPAGLVVSLGRLERAGPLAGVVYAFGMTAMFGVSAAYDRRKWSPPARRRIRRVGPRDDLRDDRRLLHAALPAGAPWPPARWS